MPCPDPAALAAGDRVKAVRPLLACVVCALAAGCSLPPGDQTGPEAVHYKWLEIRQSGDLNAMWQLLHPSVRAEFDSWHQAEKEAVNLIRTRYPKSDVKGGLKAIGGEKRARLPNGNALFKSITDANQIDGLGFLAGLGARVRSVTLNDANDVAELRTWASDIIVVKKGSDDLWYATLPALETERLKGLVQRAKTNLRRIKANLQKLAQ